MPELFDGSFDASASGPNIVKKNVGGFGVDGDFGIEAEGVFSLSEASFTVGSDLDSIFIAKENWSDGNFLEFGKMFSNEKCVVEPTSSNMVSSGGEGNQNGIWRKFREPSVNKFSKNVGKSADGMVFVIMDKKVEKFATFAEIIVWREGGVFSAFTMASFLFANRTNISGTINDVFFTTVTKWGSKAVATPAIMGSEKLKGIR